MLSTILFLLLVLESVTYSPRRHQKVRIVPSHQRSGSGFARSHGPPRVNVILGPDLLKHVRNTTHVVDNYGAPALGFELKNGMKILFMTSFLNENEVKFLLDVNIGFLANTIPGSEETAHLVEHLVMRGNTIDSSESDFVPFIKKRLGSVEGETRANHTFYSFKINKRFFNETLTKFIKHLFEPGVSDEQVKKEVFMVTDERLVKTKNWNYVWAQFFQSSPTACKNRQSLSRIKPSKAGFNLTETVRLFHKKYYKPGLMAVVVQTAQSASTDLAQSVLKVLGPLKGKNKIEQFIAPTIPWKPSPSLMQKVMSMDTPRLDVYFNLPPRFYLKHRLPDRINAVLNQKRPDSFSEVATTKGLATAIEAEIIDIESGMDNVEALQQPAKNLLVFHIPLTNNGFARYGEVLQLLFAHLKVIQSFPKARWIEDKQMEEIEIEVIEEAMHDNTMENVLSSILSAPFSLSFIKDILSYVNTTNFSYQLVGAFSDLIGHTLKDCAGFKHTLEQIPRHIIDICTLSDNDPIMVQTRALNVSIRLAMKNYADSNKWPSVIFRNSKNSLWFVFTKSEKISARFQIRTSAVDLGQVKNVILKNLFHEMLIAQLTSTDYCSEALLYKNPSGFSIVVNLDTPDMSILNNCTSYVFKQFIFNPRSRNAQKLFSSSKKKISSFYERLSDNLLTEINSVVYMAPMAIGDHFYLNRASSADYESLTISDVVEYAEKYFSHVHTNILVSGPLLKSDVLSILSASTEIMEEQFNSKPADMGKLSKVVFPSEPYVLINKTIKGEVQSATIVGFLFDRFDTRSVTTMNLLMPIFGAETLFKLRTTENLGYVTHHTSASSPDGHVLLFVIIGIHEPKIAEQKINELFQSLKNIVSNLNNGIFEFAMEEAMDQCQRTVSSSLSNWWSAIQSGSNNFSGARSCIPCTCKYMTNGSPKYKKLVVHLNNELKHVLEP